MSRDRLRVVLPSSRVVSVESDAPERPMADDEVDGRSLFTGRLLRAVDEERMVVRGEGEPWSREAWLELPLRDYHALRDVAERLGIIASELEETTCRNCDAPLVVDPTTVPLDDLEEWYADDGPSPEPPFALDRTLRLPGGQEVGTIDMARVTARSALPLWYAVADRATPFRVTPELVQSLGIRALGRERDPKVIARALDRAPDEAWALAETVFWYLNYADRSFLPAVCNQCGTVHDVPAPWARETEPDPDVEARLFGSDAEAERRPAPVAAAQASFPDEGEFGRLVERLGAEVYRERGVRHVRLEVDPGPAPVDGSGEPLLGSYQPLYEGDAAGYTRVDFVIELYYRTFARMWEQDAPYDLEAEIRETIDHEVEHHLHHLAGRDPMDEEEREEARRDLERTFGKRYVRRAAMRETLAELVRIGGVLLITVVALGLLVGMLYALGLLRD